MSHKLGSPLLKIGTVLFNFNLVGNIPDTKLKLNIWARGVQIVRPINFRSFKLILYILYTGIRQSLFLAYTPFIICASSQTIFVWDPTPLIILFIHMSITI